MGKPTQGDLELENAEAYGNPDRAAAARKYLNASGETARRAAAEKRRAAAEVRPEVRSEPPQGRRAARKQTAD